MQTGNPKPMRITRRDFAYRSVLVAATVGAIPIEPVVRPSVAHAAPGSAQEPNLAPEAQAEINAKLQAILRRYGNRFTDAQKDDIRRIITSRQRSLEVLRAFQLFNSDQPGDVLKLYP